MKNYQAPWIIFAWVCGSAGCLSPNQNSAISGSERTMPAISLPAAPSNVITSPSDISSATVKVDIGMPALDAGKREKMLDQLVSASSAQNPVVFEATGTSQDPTWNSHRALAEGMFLLVAQDSRVMFFENMENDIDHSPLFPEQFLAVDAAIQTAKHSVGELEVAPGIFRREFATCSYQGESVGACAVVANLNSAPEAIINTWLALEYDHVAAISGGDVRAGGKMEFNASAFVSGATFAPAETAIILVRSQSPTEHRSPASDDTTNSEDYESDHL